MTAPQLRLHIHGVQLVLKSDAPRVLDLARRTYARFLGESASSPGAASVVCEVDSDGQAGQVMVTIDGRALAMPHTPYWEGDVCDQALAAAFAAAPDHLFVHGAAASAAERGLLVVGHSHHGKTTLALELARRGCGFLGDDIVALGRRDRLVYPFAKSVRVWPHDLPKHVHTGAPRDPFLWAGKHVLDVEDLYPGCMGDAVPLTHVVVLRDAREPLDAERDAPGEAVDVLLERTCPAIDAYLRAVALGPLREYSLSGKPVLRLRVEDRQRLAASLVERCAQERVELIWVGKRLDVAPSFDGPAALRPISRVLAARALLQHLRGQPAPGAPLDEARSRASRLFLDLAQTTAQAECFELTLGPLKEMAELLLSLVGSP